MDITTSTTSIDYITMFLGLICVGIFIVMVTFIIGFNNSNSLTGTIVGYGIILVGIVLFSLFSINSKYKNLTVLQLFVSTTPFLLIIASLLFTNITLSTYFNNISKSNVNEKFGTLVTLFLIFTFIQVFAIFHSRSSPMINYLLPYILSLLGTINIIISIFIHVNLKYFTTDGFRIIQE